MSKPPIVTASGEALVEPAWNLLWSDPAEIETASAHWRRVAIELRERDLLTLANGAALERLVHAYILYDRAAREVARNGACTPAAPNNPRSIPRVSPSWTAMRAAAAIASALEAELALSPRRRASGAKVARRHRAERASDSYLRPINGGRGGGRDLG